MKYLKWEDRYYRITMLRITMVGFGNYVMINIDADLLSANRSRKFKAGEDIFFRNTEINKYIVDIPAIVCFDSKMVRI